MSGTPPPRLHVLMAREAPFAVVLRRGPSRAVASLLWDRRDDSVRLGQWLRGTIYEKRCDLSPDGRHMICFAATHRPGGPTGGSWTAVSCAPWLKALDLWPKGDAWQGGGGFLGNRRYWLWGCHGAALARRSGLGLAARPPFGPQFNNECLGIYFQRLRRDGWSAEREPGRGDPDWRHQRPLAHGWRLHRITRAEAPPPPNRRIYWDEHLLEGPGGLVVAGTDWEWAERDGADLVWAEGGCLWRRRIGPDERLGEPRLVHDFRPMAFEAIAAPY